MERRQIFGTLLELVLCMNNNRITKNYMTAGLATLAASICLSIAVQSPTPEAVVVNTPMVEEMVISEPIYIIVDRVPGASMATADLPVEVIVVDEPLAVTVGPRPTMAQADLPKPDSEVAVIAQR
jgi:hypothetical protein